MRSFLFDFDGTLVDSMKQFSFAMTKILDDNGIEYPDDIIKIVTPLGYLGSAKYYIAEMGLKMTEEEAIADITKNAVYEYTYNVMAKPTVIDTVKKLKELGYSLNILTASPHTVLDVCLKRLGLWDCFDNIWSCDDFKTTKADPNIYHMCAEKIGTAVENCYFLDDNINSLATGKKAGMITVGVHDATSDEYTEQIKAQNYAYINEFSEIFDKVIKL